MRALANWQFDLRLPLQTPRGTAQGLRCSKSTVYEYVKSGDLELIDGKITTQSILDLIEKKRQQSKQTEVA